jgi:hypothetical protein
MITLKLLDRKILLKQKNLAAARVKITGKIAKEQLFWTIKQARIRPLKLSAKVKK